jgi:hypothetical protein
MENRLLKEFNIKENIYSIDIKDNLYWLSFFFVIIDIICIYYNTEVQSKLNKCTE